MGFTPWPYDMTLEALDKTYDFINKNGNIVAHHLDGGLPWGEALSEKPFSKHLKSDWQTRLSKTSKDQKIFLSITPLNFERNGLASYWNEKGDNQALPAKWKNKHLNDPDVKKSYLNYALRAIKAFKPSFVAIGIESNIIITHNPKIWKDYLELNAYVYEKIKNTYPNLPVFSTVQYEHLRGIEDVSKKNQPLQIPAVRQLLKHSDYLALSTYRYGYIHPNPPTDNYFDIALSFKKPIAIAESGAMSQTTIVMGMPLISNETSQENFMGMILSNAQKHKFVFVINWVSKDFDKLLKHLPKDAQAIAKAWVHTGLITNNNKEKKAFKLWKEYLNKR